jgi:ABC-2 type transport system ATP-binding protein
VRGLDLAVGAGELYGFLGPNGAGKTTTIRMLAGLLRPSEGGLRIGGLDYRSDARAIKQITGLVPDTPPLHDYLTGRQYIGLVASLWHVNRRDRDARAASLLDTLELTEVADELCKGYSHGTRKKIHIAAVLVTAPRVLLLDEPTTGLDPVSARRLKDLLKAEAAAGTTVLLSTHVLETAEQICHRIGVLDQGSLKAEGTMPELRARFGEGSLEDLFLRLLGREGAPARHDGSIRR